MQVINCISIIRFIQFIREPLAKAFTRNYVLPEKLTDPKFTYGNETAFNDYNAKDVIAPNDV